MHRARRLILTTTAAVAVAAAAPAVGAAQVSTSACPGDLNVNTCVNAGFDAAIWAIDTTEDAYRDATYKPVPNFCTLWRKLGGYCIDPPPPR